MLKHLFSYSLILVSSVLYSQQSFNKIVASYSGKVFSTEGINSSHQDFSVVLSNDKAYFASSREQNQVNYGENNWKNDKKIKVFEASIENLTSLYDISFSKVKYFSPLLEEFSHTGPITFSSSGDTLFYSQSTLKNSFKVVSKTRRPQLFMLTKVDGKWLKSAIPMPFNDFRYSFGHPCYDSKSKTLYFASDLEGGKGKKDIYYSRIENGQWTDPINMTSVNTSANEMYPYLAEDKSFFFSSDRELGLGGLDVYYKVENQEVMNLDYLNTEADDFGLFMYNNQKMGFLSSNRDGNDDIFVFSMTREMVLQNNLLGKFNYRKLDQNIERPLEVFLLNAQKEVVSETSINENGEFQFFDLNENDNYTVQANSKADMDLQVFDSEGNPDQMLLADEYGDFVYELIDLHDIDKLNMMQVDKNGIGKISGRFLYEDDQFKEPGELVVDLVDDKGDVAYTVKSDKNGNFDFENLPPNENYIVKLTGEDKDKGLTLVIFNEERKIVERLKDDGNGYFLYQKMKLLNINNLGYKSALHEGEFMFDSGTIFGNFNINEDEGDFGKGLDLSVYNGKGELIERIKSNNEGKFVCSEIFGIEDYTFKLDDPPKSLELTELRLIIEDENGEMIKEIVMNENGEFKYQLLKVPPNGLEAKESMDEGTFDFFSSLYGNVKYDDENIVFPEGLLLNVLNESDEIIYTKRTSVDGTFDFIDAKENEVYKFEIIDKPNHLLGELFSIEINNEKGELLSHVEISEKGEFIYEKLKVNENNNLAFKNALSGENFDLIFNIAGDFDYKDNDGRLEDSLTVFAYDGNGKYLGKVMTDQNGDFVFEQLPGLTTILFKLENLDTNLVLNEFSLFIKDENGKKLAKLRSSEKGYFVYKPLGYKVDLTAEMKKQLTGNAEKQIFGHEALDVSVEIESVYFGSNRTNPNSADMIKIEKTLILLEINKGSKIEINAYADSRASDKYNLILSERRAQWIQNYFVKKGIEKSRVIINAYGEGKLVNDCEDGVDCEDKLHALNRRAELRLIN